jgi:GH43 family beta-xylosidase
VGGVRRSSIPALVVTMMLLLALLVVPANPSQAVGETSFTNPILPNGADPWLEFHNGNYYLATTTWNQQLVMRKSPTLAGLRTAAPVHVWSSTIPSRCCNFWAFEFHRLNGPNGLRWYMMYTSGQANTLDVQHLSVLESVGSDPMGPYRYMGEPLGTRWGIDGTYLEHNRQLYLLWSEWINGLQSIRITTMSNPWTANGIGTVISQPTLAWEREGGNTNEAPEVIQRNGRTFVTFSASSCNGPDYKLGLLELTGSNPLNAAAWTKTQTPVFERGNGVYGPAHNGFFTSPDGTQDWPVYHGNATTSQGCGDTRSTRAQPFTWNANGTPTFGAPVSTSTSLPVPSGELGPITAPVEGAAYRLTNRNSALCMSTAGSSADGASAAQQSCGSGAEWVLDPTADGYYRLINDGSGKVLDVADCSTAAGADVRLWTWADNTCQQWRLQPVGTVAVTSPQSGKVLDVANCSTATGTDVRQWPWLDTPCQEWTFEHTDNGYYRIHPAHSTGSCLIVAGGSTADGANVTQGACSGNNSQWRVEPLSDGAVRLVARHSGKPLDLDACGLADGTTIQQWSWLDNICQRFHLRPV